MSEVEKARHLFDDAMRLMRGTPKARALCFDLFERAIAAVRAESVWHVVQCSCHVTHDLEECADWNAERRTDEPHTDPLCLPGLKREAIIRAEARLAALIEAHEALPGIVTLLAEARAELERLKQPAPQPIGGSDDPT